MSKSGLCEFCTKQNKNVAIYFTRDDKFVCYYCASIHNNRNMAPLWARKETPTLTYVDENENGDWVGLYFDDSLGLEGHSISGLQVLRLLEEKGIIKFQTKDGTECIKDNSRFPADLNEVF